jgi:hypothetical protein
LLFNLVILVAVVMFAVNNFIKVLFFRGYIIVIYYNNRLWGRWRLV